MYRRVDNLLRLPQLWCHILDLALLVCHDQLLRIVEAGLASEEGPTWSEGQPTLLCMYPGLLSRRMRKDEEIETNPPRISDARCMAHATPIRAQVILRLGQLPVAWDRGGHLDAMVSKLPAPSMSTAVISPPSRNRSWHESRTMPLFSLVMQEGCFLQYVWVRPRSDRGTFTL